MEELNYGSEGLMLSAPVHVEQGLAATAAAKQQRRQRLETLVAKRRYY